MSTKPQICKHPDCNRKLSRQNHTGVCRAHNHAPGVCQCRQCTGQAGKSTRPDRRSHRRAAPQVRLTAPYAVGRVMSTNPRTWQEYLAAERRAAKEMRREWLTAMAAQFSETAAIARALEIDRGTLRREALKLGVTLPTVQRAPRITVERMRECADAGMTLRQTASKLDCNYEYLAGKAARLGVQFRRAETGRVRSNPCPKPAAPKAEPRRAMTMADLAAQENAAMRRAGRV